MSEFNENGFIINPGKDGIDCLHNGEQFDESGELIDCHCGECSHYLTCFGHEVLEYFKNEIEKRKI